MMTFINVRLCRRRQTRLWIDRVLPLYLSVHLLFIVFHTYICVDLFIYVPNYLSSYLFICPSVNRPTHPSIHLSTVCQRI